MEKWTYAVTVNLKDEAEDEDEIYILPWISIYPLKSHNLGKLFINRWPVIPFCYESSSMKHRTGRKSLNLASSSE